MSAPTAGPAEKSAGNKRTPKMPTLRHLVQRIATTALGRRGGLALGACLLAAAIAPAGAAAIPSEHPFEIIPGSFHLTTSTSQAGAHEDLTTAFDFAHNEQGQTYNDVRTTIVNLPPGFLGNNTAMPTCTDAELVGGLGKKNSVLEPECPNDTQVGQISFDFTFFSEPEKWTFPVYNMETDNGVTATLGFKALLLTQILPISFRPNDSGLTITSPSIEDLGEIHNVTVTIWGVPAAASHNAQRGEECDIFGGGMSWRWPGSQHPGQALPLQPDQLQRSAAHNDEIGLLGGRRKLSEESTEVAPIRGCERDPFYPSLEVQPTTRAAESPTGLNASLIVPQTYEDPETLATSHMKKAVVTLPEGFSLNPSSGSGLGSCTPAQYEAETAFSQPGEGCPSESKVGTVEVETPVLSEKAGGAVYVARPFENPFDNLLTLYVVAKIPERGIIVKAAGKVEPNPVTGQLTTTFDNIPQLPFNKFSLKFRQGATSPLSTRRPAAPTPPKPSSTPYSRTRNPAPPDQLLRDDQGHNGPCPSAGPRPSTRPDAGTINNAAGHYSPFYIRITRKRRRTGDHPLLDQAAPGSDRQAGRDPLCSDAAIAAAKARAATTAARRRGSRPSCPAASEVGHTLVGAGVGSTLAYAPGKIYLAGPYHGSALSVVSITAAKVGPFDLGTVVVRFALKINPETAEVFVDATGSDPIPHIIDGIPAHLRDIRAYVDRPEFVLNPTSCERTSTASTVLGSGLNFASEADDQPVTVTTPFQAADCAGLGFKPEAEAEPARAAPSAAATPAFKAVLTGHGPATPTSPAPRSTLPHSEFLDNAHIGTVCTRVQFAQGHRPRRKVPRGLGLRQRQGDHPDPLRTARRPGLPALRRDTTSPTWSPPCTATRSTSTSSATSTRSRRQIRNTFEAVPDAPVTKFTLEMQGGKKGLLENSANLCAATHRAIADFTGHNGKIEDLNPVLAAKCAKKGKGKHHKRKAGRDGAGSNG